MYLPTYIYHSLPRSRKRPVRTLTGTIGRPAARSLALRRPGFGVLLSFAPGSRLLSYPTSASILAHAPPQSCDSLARAYLGAYPSSLYIEIYHTC